MHLHVQCSIIIIGVVSMVKFHQISKWISNFPMVFYFAFLYSPSFRPTLIQFDEYYYYWNRHSIQRGNKRERVRVRSSGSMWFLDNNKIKFRYRYLLQCVWSVHPTFSAHYSGYDNCLACDFTLNSSHQTSDIYECMQ